MNEQFANLPPAIVAELVEIATRRASEARKESNLRRYKRRYARIGRAIAEGRKQ